jgi:hypothetical protein
LERSSLKRWAKMQPAEPAPIMTKLVIVCSSPFE